MMYRSREARLLLGALSAELSEQVLAIEDGAGQREFARASVREVRVVENAPERPWLIAGITLAAGIFGGLGGYMVGPSCPPDAVCMDWGAPLLGFALGTGVGLALSFPITGQLGDWKYARRGRD